jgi:hypothetical protein
MTEHLDDETLSAKHDGEEPPSPHLDGCATCRARSHELQAAVRLIGGTVPPTDAAQRETAIVAAMRSHAPVRARWRPSGPALAIAARVLAVAAMVPVLASRGGDSNKSAGRANTAADSREAATSGPTANALMAPATVEAGELGTIDGDLRERVVAAMKAAPATQAPLPDTPFACDNDLRTMDKKAGSLVLFGTATVNDRPGYDLVYNVVDSDPARLAAYVVAQDSCSSILQFASFTAPTAGEGAAG